MNNRSSTVHRRQLGDTEASYYLPAREAGVNDMYLHIGLQVPASLVQRARVRLVWAILRSRHPLLASRVEMKSYEDISYVYDAPHELSQAVDNADENLDYRTQGKDELIDSYLNGPRTLSNERLSYLVVAFTSDADAIASEDQPVDVSILICATHFLGDGMALHQFANHFFSLLGGSLSDSDLENLLKQEIQERWGPNGTSALPRSLEDRLPPPPPGRLRHVIGKVDFDNSQRKFIGGHAFSRKGGQGRHTIVPTVPFGEAQTRAMLKSCKAHGVSISAAVFALCNVAWHHASSANPKLPIMMYSALNLRPYLVAPPNPLEDSYWYIAIGYFNVVLPSFLPEAREELVKIFWHRARSAKEQSAAAAKHPRVLPRTREMATERAKRARVWAKEDDEKALGIWKAPEPKPTPQATCKDGNAAVQKAPSTALMGLSLLGNLDGMYKHETFGKIKLHTLTTGSRQRAGGMLLFAYTFVGKLWLSLGYDENGFEKELVERFWKNLLQATDDLLMA